VTFLVTSFGYQSNSQNDTSCEDKSVIKLFRNERVQTQLQRISTKASTTLCVETTQQKVYREHVVVSLDDDKVKEKIPRKSLIRVIYKKSKANN